jgi:hypothetical protein
VAAAHRTTTAAALVELERNPVAPLPEAHEGESDDDHAVVQEISRETARWTSDTGDAIR